MDGLDDDTARSPGNASQPNRAYATGFDEINRVVAYQDARAIQLEAYLAAGKRAFGSELIHDLKDQPRGVGAIRVQPGIIGAQNKSILGRIGGK